MQIHTIWCCFVTGKLNDLKKRCRWHVIVFLHSFAFNYSLLKQVLNSLRYAVLGLGSMKDKGFSLRNAAAKLHWFCLWILEACQLLIRRRRPVYQPVDDSNYLKPCCINATMKSKAWQGGPNRRWYTVTVSASVYRRATHGSWMLHFVGTPTGLVCSTRRWPLLKKEGKRVLGGGVALFQVLLLLHAYSFAKSLFIVLLL